jgi:2-oxoglutarate dehydrogenase E1 component
MSTQQVDPTAAGAAAASALAAPDSDREQVFEAFRRWGYLEADLDPLGFLQPETRPELRIEGEITQEARRVYCGTVGAEFVHIADPERRHWIQKRLEGPQLAVNQSVVLDQLIRADLFEQILQHRYLGSKRFSLEGDHRADPACWMKC